MRVGPTLTHGSYLKIHAQQLNLLVVELVGLVGNAQQQGFEFGPQGAQQVRRAQREERTW